MATPQNFRSAFNGFNREDVVHYISYITAKHETQVNELKAEAEELRAQMREQETNGRTVTDLVTEQARLRKELDSRAAELAAQKEAAAAAEEKADQLQAELSAKNEELNSLRLEMEQALASRAKTGEPSGRWTEELNAYRRAEKAERQAQQRVNQMYDKASAALAEASVRMERSAGQVSELAQKVQTELEKLHNAIGDSENILADTAMVLSAIRPKDGED